MHSSNQTKTCFQCEADVNVQATYCPFCGSNVLSEEEEPDLREPKREIKESLASLYKPPYSTRSREGLGVPDEREETAFVQAKPPREDPLFQSYQKEREEEEEKVTRQPQEKKSEQRGSLWPLILLSIGGYLFALGALILLFAKEGNLTLQWQTRYWLLYWLLGLPFLVFGVRHLKLNA